MSPQPSHLRSPGPDRPQATATHTLETESTHSVALLSTMNIETQHEARDAIRALRRRNGHIVAAHRGHHMIWGASRITLSRQAFDLMQARGWIERDGEIWRPAPSPRHPRRTRGRR